MDTPKAQEHPFEPKFREKCNEPLKTCFRFFLRPTILGLYRPSCPHRMCVLLIHSSKPFTSKPRPSKLLLYHWNDLCFVEPSNLLIKELGRKYPSLQCNHDNIKRNTAADFRLHLRIALGAQRSSWKNVSGFKNHKRVSCSFLLLVLPYFLSTLHFCNNNEQSHYH